MSKLTGGDDGSNVGSGEAPQTSNLGTTGDGNNQLLGLLRKIGSGAALGGVGAAASQKQQQAGAPTQFVAQPNQLSPDYYSMLQPQQQQQPRLFR